MGKTSKSKGLLDTKALLMMLEKKAERRGIRTAKA